MTAVETSTTTTAGLMLAGIHHLGLSAADVEASAEW
jgi:hypothetical protein